MADAVFGPIANDPGKTRHRRQLLQRLADNTKDPAIAELARDLMSGRTTPRQVMSHSGYFQQFDKAMASFGSWYRRLSDEERDAVCQQERQRLDALGEELSAPAAGTASPVPAKARRVAKDEQDYTPDTWLE